jgi:hypothetical protein
MEATAGRDNRPLPASAPHERARICDVERQTRVPFGRTNLAWLDGGGRVTNNVAISTEEVVWGLLRAGFAITQRAASATVLQRGLFVVAIPTVTSLPPEALTIILRDAGIDEERFLDLFGDAPTERSSIV